MRKKHILQRIEDIEKSNAEKDKVIEYLTEKVKHLEEKSQEIDISSQVKCERCTFIAKKKNV